MLNSISNYGNLKDTLLLSQELLKTIDCTKCRQMSGATRTHASLVEKLNGKVSLENRFSVPYKVIHTFTP